MYRYDEFDHEFVNARVAQFRDQVARRLSGELSEDEFKPLRLMNGVYLQLHAYMLRVAIPYGTLNSRQMRMLGHIARKYDRDYGHFTTRQNIQFNWPKLIDIPQILEDLASVEMHAIQTSGNCIRNVTTDHFAGVARDEIADPRVYAEILRQWSSLHPEFVFLPRKFKIAITGAAHDRAAIQVHDIGLQLKRNDKGETGFAVHVGGGQGRTPMIAKLVREFLPEGDLIAYTEAILRVYNLYGRRDNKYKARIKILVHETGIDELRRDIEKEFERIRDGVLHLPKADIDAINSWFARPLYRDLPATSAMLEAARKADRQFDRWVKNNVTEHIHRGHAIVTVSLKPAGAPPGDATARQMEVLADLGERFSHDELRISHEQNVILPHVAKDDLKIGLRRAGRRRPCRRQCRPRHRHHRLPRPRLLRARQCPLDSGGAAHLRGFRGLGARTGNRRAEDQDFRLHQCLRAPPCRPYRHSRRRPEGRGILPDHARRFGGRAHFHRRNRRSRLFDRRGRGRCREDRRHLPGPAAFAAEKPSCRPGGGSGSNPSRKPFMVEEILKERTITQAWKPRDAEGLATRFASSGARKMLETMLAENAGKRIALVSSFGSNSVVLLHLVASVDSSLPVLFIDTGKLFGCDAALSRGTDADAWPHQCAQHRRAKEPLVRTRSGRRAVACRQDCLLLAAQGGTLRGSTEGFRHLDFRPQALPGRHARQPPAFRG